MEALGGYVETNQKGKIVHIIEEYNRVTKFLNVETEERKVYRDRVIGKTALVSAPQDYYSLSIIKELGISIKEWDAYPVESKAKLTSHHYLKIMIEVIDNHYKEQLDEMKSVAKKGS